MKRALSGIAGAGFIVFLVIQIIRPTIPQRPAANEIHVPANVRAVLEKDCYSCHSDEPRLAWFDQVQPAYWLVRKDVLDARRHLNFSTLGSKPESAQKGALYEAVAMMQLGAMPLPRYRRLHPEARVTAEDLRTIQDYLAPWNSPIPAAPTGNIGNAGTEATTPLSVQPALNGIPYDASWNGWRLLAVTDRGDNRQFRMILGNDIAIKAAREGQVHPWPDGTRFAKVAWLQERTPEGLVVPGQFFQIELMVKDAQQFSKSAGWGWARWRGADLKPYGMSAAFVKECTGCHYPVRSNDDVYTQPISAASVPGEEVLNNAAARLPAGLASNPLDWLPVTIYGNPELHTLSVLFVDSEHGGAATTGAAGGSERALVTWAERDDPHWFGAGIAGPVVSVELVRPGANNALAYQKIGSEGSAEGGVAASRASFIDGLQPAPAP
jgi:Haem-binding domain/Cytochrome P460